MIDADAAFSYGVFWAAYGLAFLVLFFLLKALLRVLPLYGLRTLLLAALAVLLLTPVESPEVAGWWIPAWLFAGYELILGDVTAAGSALVNFTLASLLMLLVWILDLVRYRLVRK
ncbi:MAG TPA: hypothetical protein VKY53_04095 [Marinobacter sp.]|nr:hypothetical protein [Marinobacter sp.]